MNGSPEGTPNPLNPNPATSGAGPAPVGAPMQNPAQAAASARPVGPPRPAATRPATPTGLSMDFMQPRKNAPGRGVGVPSARPVAGSATQMRGPARPVSQVNNSVQQPANTMTQATAQAQPAMQARASVRPATSTVWTGRPVQPTKPVAQMGNMGIQNNGSFDADNAIDTVIAESSAAESTEGLVASDSIVEPKKKKEKKNKDDKRGKKVAIIISVILAISAIACGAVAAVILLTGDSGNRVDTAISKWLNNEIPNNVALDGSIIINNSNPDIEFASLQININSQNDRLASTNNTSALVMMTLQNQDILQFNVNEIQVNGGDLFMQFSNVASIDGGVESQTTSDATNCITDENGETNCEEVASDDLVVDDCVNEDGEACAVVEPTLATSGEAITSLMTMFEAAGDGWIRIPLGEVNTNEADTIDDSALCLDTMFGSISKNRNSIAELYRKNPFIMSSTENLTILARADDPIYRLEFDKEKLADFSNALSSTSFANDVFACANNYNLGTKLDSMFDDTPVMYVEVDDNNNFTRVYFGGVLTNTQAAITIDLDLSYPSVVQVNEPTNYMDLTQLLTNIMTGAYGSTIVTNDGMEDTVIVEDKPMVEDEFVDEITE